MPIESVSKELNCWYEKNCAHGKLSWKTLEKKTGVTVSSITKIARGEIQRPKYETAAVLLKAVLPDDKAGVEDYISAVYGAEDVEFDPDAPSARKKLSAKTTAALWDFVAFRLFKLSMSGRHLIKEIKARMGGEDVLPRLQVLKDLGLVYVDKTGFLRRRPGSQTTRNNNTSSVADEFKHVIDLVAAKKVLSQQGNSSIDNEINKLLHLHMCVDQDKLPEMSKDIRDFLKKLSEKYDVTDSPNGVEVFVNVATGRFDFK